MADMIGDKYKAALWTPRIEMRHLNTTDRKEEDADQVSTCIAEEAL
jgi:hypothetical protein